MKIKLTASVEMRDHLGELLYQGEPGQVLDLSDDQAMRWLKRNKAERYVEGEAKDPDPPAATEASAAEPKDEAGTAEPAAAKSTKAKAGK